MSTGQARAQIVRPVGIGAILVRIPVAYGRHPVGRSIAVARTRLLQVLPQAFGQVGPGRLLCAHFAVHGYIGQVFFDIVVVVQICLICRKIIDIQRCCF